MRAAYLRSGKVAVSKRPMPAVMRTYSTAVAYWSGLNPNSLSTIIEAPQATIEPLNGAFSPSSEGVVLLAANRPRAGDD